MNPSEEETELRTVKWPNVRFTNRHGIVECGDVAYADERETVVAVSRPPKLVPTPYGLRMSGTVYETVQNQYLKQP